MTEQHLAALARKKTTLTAFVIQNYGVSEDAIRWLVSELVECKARHGELNLNPCKDCGDEP